MTNVMSCDAAVPAARARATKAGQQAMWASGDFAVIGATLQIAGERTAFLGLDREGQNALHADLVGLLQSHDVGGPDGLVVHDEYLETFITK